MKHFKSLLVSLSMAAGVLFAPSSTAGLIYNGTISGGSNTYIGTYNPASFDTALFNHSLTTPGAFSDLFIFMLAPGGLATTNANFVPTTSIAGFLIELLSATGTSGCGVLGTACSTLVTGAVLATGVPGLASSNIGFIGLAAGTYAIRVSGNTTSAPALWSGQLATQVQRVPEPATLALLGLGLAGLGFARRKTA